MGLRKKRRRALISIDSGGPEDDGFHGVELVDHAGDPERHFVRREREERLHRAMRHLSERLRCAVEMVASEEMAMDEGARKLNISPVAFKSRLHRVKISLRARLEKRRISSS